MYTLFYKFTSSRLYIYKTSPYVVVSAGSIPGFVRYLSIPEFCLILGTYYVICLIFT